MEDYQLVLEEGEPNPEDKKVIVDGLLENHASSGHPREPKEIFSILLKNNDGKLIGGVIASILWNGMEIDSLWIEKSLRGKGEGGKLIEAAEKEGLKRGCTISYTNTFSWQAPEFYEKMGYSLYGKLDGFPEGNSLSYYFKKLS